MTTQNIPTENITLGYTCVDCETKATQPLADITYVGTLICPECGDDMQLEPTHHVVLVSESGY